MMTKLLYIIPLALLLCGCVDDREAIRKQSDGHIYLRIPGYWNTYAHDPQCGKCQEMKK